MACHFIEESNFRPRGLCIHQVHRRAQQAGETVRHWITPHVRRQGHGVLKSTSSITEKLAVVQNLGSGSQLPTSILAAMSVPVGQRSPHHQRSTGELAPGANSPGQQKVYVPLFQRSSSPWPFFWEPHPHNLSGPSARASCNPQSRRPWPVLAGHTQNPRSDPPYAGSPQKSQYVKRCQKNAIGIQHETKLMT
jgi:hypothetical protein